MTSVPAQYQPYVNQAAQALGISPNIVAAQINLESGWNPNAVSYAGAQGIAQFEPGTFAAYGSGSPFNPSDAFAAYTNYMRSLLNDFHGDLRNALAAYNAGPGNIGAGMGYANKILNAAGSGDVTTSTTGGTEIPSPQNNWQNLGQFGGLLLGDPNKGPFAGTGLPGGLGDIANGLTAMTQDLSTFFNMVSLLFKPSTWLRIGAFIVGGVFLILGSASLANAVRNK